MSSIFEGAVYYAEIYFFEKDATFWRPFGYKNKKKAEWMPTNLIQRIPKSRDTTQKKTRRVLSHSQKEYARTREAESVWNRRSVVFLLFLLVVVI